MASSGQAFKHNPHASQRSALTNIACCHLCAKPFSLPRRLNFDLISLGSVSTLKTPTGQTETIRPYPRIDYDQLLGYKCQAHVCIYFALSIILLHLLHSVFAVA